LCVEVDGALRTTRATFVDGPRKLVVHRRRLADIRTALGASKTPCNIQAAEAEGGSQSRRGLKKNGGVGRKEGDYGR
jgi:hypothetical protein